MQETHKMKEEITKEDYNYEPFADTEEYRRVKEPAHKLPASLIERAERLKAGKITIAQ